MAPLPPPPHTHLVLLSAPVTLQGALQGALPPDCQDALLSETHLLLLRRGTVLEGWEVGSAPGLDGKPTWQRELPPEDAGTGGDGDRCGLGRSGEQPGRGRTDPPPFFLLPPALPLVAGGYVFPRPPFFAPLPAGLRVQKLALGHEHVVLLDDGGALFTWGSGR